MSRTRWVERNWSREPAGQRISVAIHIHIIKDKTIVLKVASILLSHEATAKATLW